MSDTIGFRPTLIIGVGGTGCDIAERVHRQARTTTLGQQGRLGILCFDTDANDMRRFRGMDARSLIRFSTTDTVFQLLDKNLEVEATWFGPRQRLSQDLLTLTLIDGAAQIRLFTRLALHHAIRGGGIERTLGDALAGLAAHRAQDRFEGVVNVMMVGSLAGATGSGSYLQLALLIGALGRQRGVAVEVRGLFLLPDVFLRAASLPIDQVRNVRANGYAALKELSAINARASGREEAADFDFEYAAPRRVEAGGHPFRSMSLIDFEGTGGGSFGRSFEAYKAMATRATYQLVFSPIGQKTASVAVNDARAKLAAAAEGVENIYAGLGVAAVDYPAQEVAHYLELRLALENLGGDWLRLDRDYLARVRRYEEQKRQGNLSITAPDQGRSFLTDLDTLALRDRMAFFAEVRARLHPEVRDEATGALEVRPRHVEFLAALQREVLERFWSNEKLLSLQRRQVVDTDNLRNLTTLTDNVRRLENQLDGDLETLDRELRQLPADLFTNVLLTGDDLSEPEWRDYHLQSYLVRGGPHLVEVRAFLYALREAIEAARAPLDPGKERQQVMRAANAFDEERSDQPTERRARRIVELAREAGSRNIFQRLVKGSPENFIADYVEYYNGSVSALRRFAETSVRATVLTLLAEEVEALSRALSGLFVELGAVFRQFERDAASEAARHGPGAGLIDGNVPVFASAAAKDLLWNDLAQRTLGLRLGAEANTALARAVFRQHREDRRERRAPDARRLSDMFLGAIRGQFAAKVVEGEFRSVWDFSIVEAVKREAALRGTEWHTLLRDLVDRVSSHAEPFLKLTDSSEGQRVIFWAVHPSVRAEMNDDAAYAELFTFQQGEAPLEGPEFSRQTLLCMNTRVNLELRDLSKLAPGVTGPAHVNRPPRGDYAAAYAEMVDGLIEAELNGRASREFTPHLDARWHVPGAMPEIFPELTEAVRRQQARAFVIAFTQGLLRFEHEYGAPVVEFSTLGRVAQGGMHDRLARSHDLWAILRSFEPRAAMARATDRFWTETEASVGTVNAREPAPLDRLRDGAALAALLGIALERREEHARDAAVARLAGAWAVLLREHAIAIRPDLAEPGRDGLARGWIGEAAATARALLLDGGAREETMRIIDRLLARGLEAVPQAARP
jgi:hypothetical protein